MNYKEDRPWGWFEILLEDEDVKVKRILVKEGMRLSLQSHEHRSENWTIVQGESLITLDTESKKYSQYEIQIIADVGHHCDAFRRHRVKKREHQWEHDDIGEADSEIK